MKTLKKPNPSLVFFTNIPTPYQNDFFKELSLSFELTVIYYSEKEQNRQWDLNKNVPYHTIFLQNNWLAKFIQNWIVDFHFSISLIRILRAESFDYSIVGGSYWIPNGIIALLWSKKNAKKTAYFSEPLFTTNNKLKHFYKKYALKILNLTCDYIFCIGEYSKKTFEDYGVTVTKYNIPYNINISSITSLDKEIIEKFKNKYKQNNERVFLTSGALIHRKGIDIVIKAFQEINNQDIKLIILGDGHLKHELKLLANNDNRIEFVGFQEPKALPYFFGIADTFIFASRYDGWAVVIMEAIAANLPIISSDKVGASVDLITNNVDGIICRSENISDFKNAIEYIIKNPDKTDEIKYNAKKLIPKISSISIAEKVFEIFNQ